MHKSVQVRVLYSQGCPNAAPVFDLVGRMANEIGTQVSIERVLVSSQEQAVELRLLGSPTVQIDGEDIDPSARGSMAFGIG
ncbi:MAG TPA: hypothetical protein PK250_07570 [Syntrophobacter fumaroxidans]|nr:hypothetical protein [Syntrophobacter fumaroxidans]